MPANERLHEVVVVLELCVYVGDDAGELVLGEHVGNVGVREHVVARCLRNESCDCEKMRIFTIKCLFRNQACHVGFSFNADVFHFKLSPLVI